MRFVPIKNAEQQSARRRRTTAAEQSQATAEIIDPKTGEITMLCIRAINGPVLLRRAGLELLRR
jgi:hypothetical protein